MSGRTELDGSVRDGLGRGQSNPGPEEPVSNLVAHPSPSNILEWHFVLEGSERTPFAGGYYYGKIKFPPKYPFEPPGITMITPNGRFMPQKKICLSMTDFHAESWNPAWSVSTILIGLLSFMMDTSPTAGGVNTTMEEKLHLAKASLAFNCKKMAFKKLFPEYVEKYNEQRVLEQIVLDGDNHGGLTGTEPINEDEQEVVMRNYIKQGNPTWAVVLFASVFGIVISLPLLQL